MHFDPEVFGAAMGDLVREAVEPLHVRIAELERQLADQPNDVESLVSERVEQALNASRDEQGIDLERVRACVQSVVSSLPPPVQGKDGASVTFDDVMPALREMTEGYLASLEVPAGKDGTSVTLEDVQPLIEKAVDAFADKALAYMEAVPKAQDGKDGADGKSVTLEDVRPWLESELAKWALEFERRAQDVLQRAIDRMPVPKDGTDGRDGRDGINGKDGRDALDLDDLEYDQDEDGRVTLRLVRGDVRKEIALRFPVFVDRGVFKEGERYERGNGVTWGGSFWIAQKDDPEGKPGEGDGFRLAVKKGRDAK